MKAITILGSDVQSGAYLLRLCVREEMMVGFGRFQGGRPIRVPKGEVVYVGSAMADKGSMTLACRLLRHASRFSPQRPHKIQELMLDAFNRARLGTVDLKSPQRKKLFWNIDYLLEEDAVELSHVFILRTRINMEDRVAHFLMEEPNSSILAKGLGAHDRRASTHIVAIRETADWWRRLPAQLEILLGEAQTQECQQG